MSTTPDSQNDPRNDAQDDAQDGHGGRDAVGQARPRRRWAVPVAFAGGAAAVALVGSLALAASDMGRTTDVAMVRAEHLGHVGHDDGRMDRAMRMQHRAEIDPAMRDERRGEHLS
jgi:hypothetical protein